MALSLWVIRIFIGMTWKWKRSLICVCGEDGVKEDGWSLESEKNYTDFYRIQCFPSMQRCRGENDYRFICISFIALFFILTLYNSPDWLTTGCFLGCRWRIWGADLRSRSVSWLDRFHSECYESLPSNPGDETWRKTQIRYIRYFKKGGIIVIVYF